MPSISEIVACGNKSLPRSLDVFVQVSKAQTEQATDLSVLVFVSNTGPLTHGAGRIRYYQNIQGIEDDFGLNSEPWKAGREFFSQRNRSKTMAVAQAFSDPQSGFLKTRSVNVDALNAITDGSFAIAIDGTNYDITGLDFSSDTDLDDIALTVEVALQSQVANTIVEAEGEVLIITSPTAGDDSTVSLMDAVDPATGTDVSGDGFLNGVDGTVVIGYAPTDFITELSLIEDAARCSGQFVYAWTLDEAYRDSQDAIDAAGWAETRRAILGLTSNDPLAWDADTSTDIGPVLFQNGYTRTIAPAYHDNAEYYPEVSILARMLGVDYAGANTAITAKFKDLPGVATVGLSTTQWITLQSKGYNSFTLIGSNSRTFRDGDQVNPNWWIDDLINLDNFTEELEVAMLNVYLRNGKVPLTPTGQAIQRDAAVVVCERYVTNGTLADREIIDPDDTSSTIVIPAYEIIQGELSGQTDADRASRIGPPMQINLQLAGANHSISINVIAQD
ncbi:DUF3383 family protein [Agarivorans sp. B2Z047]|uniref:DUF3383 family protein n=1 Tax=Agarivorans sp. B2Z047 TaxID=2652721 RepID=UPI00128D89EF|nr:DUF3383 family protein [Agarivorans sp. B2Z047]MPW31956.1 DUF3383 family protein [Agarivorans sp. B2Z047]UQN41879.1 DUF3383 domain-containing protein [Agarivorans sp. B2Z047]UQN44888.1 DUF3383 domain-containing protein [Agarivorans sp. B2Z047]